MTGQLIGIDAGDIIAVRVMPQVARRYEPDAQRAAPYLRKYRHFTQTAEALGLVWADHRATPERVPHGAGTMPQLEHTGA